MICAFFIYFCYTTTKKVDGYKVRIKDNYVEVITNVKEPCRVMHITDSHITVDDEENDWILWDKCARMHEAYKDTKFHVSGKNISRLDAFKDLIRIAKEKNVDVIVLGGDIMNFPSQKTIDTVYKILEDSGIKYFFISGNHDWHLEGSNSSDNLRRATNLPMLAPLYHGEHPLYYAVEYKGINFINIDNSTYQITNEQYKFFAYESSKRMPTVLNIHIPVYCRFNEYYNLCMGNPAWGSDFDDKAPLEKRQRWSKDNNNSETIQFCDHLKNTPNIITLAGHVHKNYVDMEGDMIQFVTGLGRDGHYRIIDFKPVEEH